MAGFFPSFSCVFIDQDGVKVHKLAKKGRGQYPAILTQQACSVKDLVYLVYIFSFDFFQGTGKVLLRDTAGSLERARQLHLARSWSQPYNKQAYGMQNTIESESENAASVYTQQAWIRKPVLMIILVQSCSFQLTDRSSLGFNSHK